jgi:hypothetical protein
MSAKEGQMRHIDIVHRAINQLDKVRWNYEKECNQSAIGDRQRFCKYVNFILFYYSI